jgi:hypothetical protein
VIVLQEMCGDIKGLARTPTYAAIMKGFDTNLTCPWIAPLPTPTIFPFWIMFIASYPLIVRRAVLKVADSFPAAAATGYHDTLAIKNSSTASLRTTFIKPRRRYQVVATPAISLSERQMIDSFSTGSHAAAPLMP